MVLEGTTLNHVGNGGFVYAMPKMFVEALLY